MAKLGLYHVAGKSGTTYPFDAYPLNTVWTPHGAVYIITHRDLRPDGTGEHIWLSAGQIRNLQELLPPKGRYIQQHVPNCVCVLLEADERRCKEILEDILGANSMPFGR